MNLLVELKFNHPYEDMIYYAGGWALLLWLCRL